MSQIIAILFDLYIFVLALRILLQCIKANYYHPVVQLVSKLTQPIINPLRKIIPNYANFDLASVFLILVLETIKFSLLIALTANKVKLGNSILLAFNLGIIDILTLTVNIFFYAILIQAIMSWIQRGYNPMADLLQQITAPILRPFQRFIPLVAGFDLSLIPAMLVLQFIKVLIVSVGATVIAALA